MQPAVSKQQGSVSPVHAFDHPFIIHAVIHYSASDEPARHHHTRITQRGMITHAQQQLTTKSGMYRWGINSLSR